MEQSIKSVLVKQTLAQQQQQINNIQVKTQFVCSYDVSIYQVLKWFSCSNKNVCFRWHHCQWALEIPSHHYNR